MALLHSKASGSPEQPNVTNTTDNADPNLTDGHNTSDGNDSSEEISDKYHEDGDDIYDKFSRSRKAAIVSILGFGAFVATMSSTSVLTAVPEISKTFHSQDKIVEVSNAIYIGLTGVGCVVWGPLSQIYGRRPVMLCAGAFFCCMGLGTVLSQNLVSFFVFRALSAMGGSALTILGNVIISDIYKPTERATAISWFLSCSVVGPAFGPFISGLIVEFAFWRIIFWVQVGCSVATVAGAFFLIPETAHYKQMNDLAKLPVRQQALAIAVQINPLRSVSLLRYGNVLIVSIASAAVLFTFYTMLVPIRFVLNPRFHLESPLLSGVFYLVPGAGYLVATQVGGKYGDWTVKQWIEKRGRRVPEDRLRAGIPALGIGMAGSVLIYGWTVDKAVGGMPVPLIFLFLQAVGQIIGLTMLNTYCLENTPSLSADIIAICWLVRYLGACIATATALPMIDGIGVGWASTIGAVAVIITTCGLMATVKWGEHWRENIVVPKKSEATEPAASRTDITAEKV